MSLTDDPRDELVGYEVADRFGDDGGVRVHGVAHLPEAPSPFGGERHPEPCSLVIFGVTGDLAHRKLMPALYDLGCHGVLPFGTTIVGYGRQQLSDDEFRAAAAELHRRPLRRGGDRRVALRAHPSDSALRPGSI